MIIRNSLVDAVFEQYMKIGGSTQVLIYFVPLLHKSDAFGRVIFNAGSCPKIEITPFLNVIDISLVLAHELAHVLDAQFSNRIWFLSTNQICNLEQGEPSWAHDDIWKNWYEKIVDPLDINEKSWGLNKCFDMLHSVTVGHEKFYTGE